MTEISIIMEDGSVMNAALYEDKAPETVKNFLSLIDQGFFDGLCFHRVIPDFMIQGGGFVDKDGELIHKEAPANVVGEFASNGVKGNDLHHEEGVLSMARAMDKNSASSQFFICVADCGFSTVSTRRSENFRIKKVLKSQRAFRLPKQRRWATTTTFR